jgi:hypothetical protein
MEQTILSAKLPIPCAVCTVCHTYTRNASMINYACVIMIDGKRCKGAWQSALKVEDWEECQSCHATDANCASCNGEGWIFIRK